IPRSRRRQPRGLPAATPRLADRSWVPDLSSPLPIMLLGQRRIPDDRRANAEQRLSCGPRSAARGGDECRTSWLFTPALLGRASTPIFALSLHGGHAVVV